MLVLAQLERRLPLKRVLVQCLEKDMTIATGYLRDLDSATVFVICHSTSWFP